MGQASSLQANALGQVNALKAGALGQANALKSSATSQVGLLARSLSSFVFYDSTPRVVSFSEFLWARIHCLRAVCTSYSVSCCLKQLGGLAAGAKASVGGAAAGLTSKLPSVRFEYGAKCNLRKPVVADVVLQTERSRNCQLLLQVRSHFPRFSVRFIP